MRVKAHKKKSLDEAGAQIVGATSIPNSSLQSSMMNMN